MKQAIVGLGIVLVFVVGMLASSSSSSGVAVVQAHDVNELTAMAVFTNSARTDVAATQSERQAVATSTAQRQETLNALADSGTQVAIAMAIDDATATQAMATAQTATAIVNGSPTAHVVTATAAAELTRAAKTEVAEIEREERAQTQRLVAEWGWVIVPLLFVLSVGLGIGLGAWQIGRAAGSRITVEANAKAKATEIEAEANAEEVLARADETRTRTARINTERIGRTLVRHTSDGNPVVLVELIPKEDVAAAATDPDGNLTIETNYGGLDRYSPTQLRVLTFLDICIQMNGKHSNVFPTATALEAAGISRDTRAMRLKALGAHVITRPGAKTGGTFLSTSYDTLVALRDAVKSGRASILEVEEEEDDPPKKRG